MGPNIGGKYRIVSELGRGPTGIVYEAVHLTLGHRVAIKLIVDEKTAADPEAVSRLLRQARAAANLRSEHVAHVYDLDITKDHLPFVVMELLEGDDLANVLKTEEAKALPIEEAVRYTIQICAAIAEAHALGIVHGNLKAENVFLQARRGVSPIVKVLDFGPTTTTTATTDDPPPSTDARANDITAIIAILRGMIAASQMKAPASLEAVLSRENRAPKAAALAEELLPFAPPGLEELVIEMIATSASLSSIKTTTSSSSVEVVPPDTLTNNTTSRLRHFLGPPQSNPNPTSIRNPAGWGRREWLLAAVFGVLLLFAGMGVSAMFR